MNILETKEIVKQYSGHLALDRVSIAVRRGSIFGLLGPNGAGKTTLLRIINNITAPDSGTLLFNGAAPQPEYTRSIGYMPEERGLYRKMKVGEQVVYLSCLKGLSPREAMDGAKLWFKKFGIQGWWNKKVEELSKGMAQKIQFIITVIHKPELLIFDEPFSGFDPVNVQVLKNEILTLREQGCTIIFSTHNMESVEELCDDIALINKSKCVLQGSIDEVRRSYSSSIFKIAFRGMPSDIETLVTEFGELLEINQKTQITEMKIRSDNGNKLLAAILPKVEIVEFSESIPAMNDIFIATVK
ncbi:MAG: ATP-binding cassette domain-containing protein [Prevotellaceae bacterium]|jgi:ABC-2 type transport system ATP-binding protein|nr:ATP-binding cassette domain-containing protein [Prevotellaceae bacterium]